MKERWLIVGPDWPIIENSIGGETFRTVVVPDCPPSRAFIVDPDTIHTTYLPTGETKTFRQIYGDVK